MSMMLVIAIVLITSALVFYTIGVWAEKIQGTLKPWHAIFFTIGLFFDTTGTLTMERIASANQVSMATSGFNLHNFTGLLAILLMLVHALWAYWVLYKKDAKQSVTFHKFSLAVWLLWLVPFLSGAVMKMF